VKVTEFIVIRLQKSNDRLTGLPSAKGISLLADRRSLSSFGVLAEPIELRMKTLGIIGGTGPETTIEYYRRLIAAYRERSPEGRSPSLMINSIESKKLVDLVTANELTQMADYLLVEVERLARAGAGLALIAANTPHLVFDEVQSRSPIPMLSIVIATRDAAAAAGLRRLALFGTRFTMQATFFSESFQGRQITIVVPNEAEQAYIHDKYMSELFVGTILPETRERLLEIVQAMKERERIDGLILGGTELSLILRESTAAGLPVLDTTQIHVDLAVEWLLQN
jgi:aspartate racemase